MGKKHRQIHIFDKARQVAYSSNLMDAASENYFNTIVLNGQRISFEGAFQDCDDLLASLAQRLVKHRRLSVLTAQDRENLAHLAAIQFLRVGLIRSTLLEFSRQLRHLFHKSGSKLVAELEEEFDSFDENAARVMSLKQLKSAPELAGHFLDKDWSLLLAHRTDPFWISDNPIVVGNVFPYGSRGLASEGVEICWPLGPEILLAFRCPTIANMLENVSPASASTLRNDPVSLCGPENVEYYNSLQIFQSSRFIYSSRKTFELAKRAIRDYPNVASERMTMMELGSLGEVPRDERMPMGSWVVVFGARTHYMCQVKESHSTPSGFSVIVADGQARLVESLLSDSPHKRAVLYRDKVPIHMMGDVVVEGSSDSSALHVSPRDLGMRRVLERSRLREPDSGINSEGETSEGR